MAAAGILRGRKKVNFFVDKDHTWREEMELVLVFHMLISGVNVKNNNKSPGGQASQPPRAGNDRQLHN